MTAQPMSDRPAARLAVNLAAAASMMLVLVAGIFVWGRLANDDRLAMALTAAWFAAVLVAAVILTRRRASLRLPLAVGYVLVGAAAAVVLGLPMLRDDVVDEQVVKAAPAPASAPTPPTGGTPAVPARNVEIASGAFQSIAHPGSGTAAVVELAKGGRKLTLTDFETDNGPDLRVYMTTANPAGGGELGDFKDLGALKGNRGDQQYAIPANVDVSRFSTVVIWCRAFSVSFTSARLAKA